MTQRLPPRRSPPGSCVCGLLISSSLCLPSRDGPLQARPIGPSPAGLNVRQPPGLWRHWAAWSDTKRCPTPTRSCLRLLPSSPVPITASEHNHDGRLLTQPGWRRGGSARRCSSPALDAAGPAMTTAVPVIWARATLPVQRLTAPTSRGWAATTRSAPILLCHSVCVGRGERSPAMRDPAAPLQARFEGCPARRADPCTQSAQTRRHGFGWALKRRTGY